MNFVQTSTPSAIVTYADIRDHQRLDDDSERDYLTSLALICTDFAERETGQCFANRTIEATYHDDDLCAGDPTRLVLPRGPVVSITSVTSDGTTLDAGDYEARRIGVTDYVYLDLVPTAPVVVTYVAGYGTNVPAVIKQAVKLHVAHLYRNREAYGDKPQYIVGHGLERIYELYNTSRVLGA